MKKRLLLTLAVVLLPAWSSLAAEAKENYEKQCAKCHGADGKGDTKMGQKLGVKDLTSAVKQEQMKDVMIYKAIREGFRDGDKVKMKAAEGLSDDEIRALVAFVRQFKK